MRIAVVGARGFVGAAICAALGPDPDRIVIPVLRQTYRDARDAGTYDVVVNGAMPSRRFWARQHPDRDFAETVAMTSQLLYDWRWKKYVQISSISARSQLDTVYGRHKAAAEQLCAFGDNLIVRLGPMYGAGLTKGPLFDIARDGTVYSASHTRCAFVPVDWVARTVTENLDRAGTIEVGANDAITLGEVARLVGSSCVFRGGEDHQEPRDRWPTAPSARAVVDHARALRRRVRGDVVEAG